MNELQECQFNILCDVVKVLEKNNLRYFLIGGTMLGAVRHKGFIPWDDDIDIGMPREDYDKFSKIANVILPNNYFYQDKKTDKNYPYNFAKVRKNNTIFLQKPVANLEMHHGIYIDIFPVDGVNENPKKMKKTVKKLAFLNYIQISYTFKNSDSIKSFKKKVQRLLLNMLRIILGNNYLQRRIDDLLNQKPYNESNFVGTLIGGEKELMQKSLYEDNDGNFGKIIFENKEFYCPIKVDEYLRHKYGEYMLLPPEDKRDSNHQLLKIKF